MRTKSLVCHLQSFGTSPSPGCSRTFVTLKEARDTVFFSFLFSIYCNALTTDGTCFSCFLTLSSFQINSRSPHFPTDYKSNSCRAIWKQRDYIHSPISRKHQWILGMLAYGSDWSKEFKMNSLSEDKPTSSRSEATEHLSALG